MEDAKRIDIGVTLNNTIEIFKKTFLISGFALLFITVFLMTIAFIGIEFFIGFEVAAEQLKTFDPANLSLKGTLIYFGSVLFITVLLAPFTAGILKMMKDTDDNQEVVFSTLFHYVNSPYYISIITATVLLTLLNFSINIGLQKLIADKTIASIITMSLSVIFSVLTFLTLPNIIFKNLRAIEAIEDSIHVTSKSFIQIILLLIIAIVIGYTGLIAFCIGIFFTFPIYYAVQYCIYKDLN